MKSQLRAYLLVYQEREEDVVSAPKIHILLHVVTSGPFSVYCKPACMFSNEEEKGENWGRGEDEEEEDGGRRGGGVILVIVTVVEVIYGVNNQNG